MLYKNIFIDGKNVLINGVYFESVNWRELGVSDQSRDVVGTHSRIVSPTYARVRIITLTGLVDRRIADKKAVDHLESLFYLQRHIEAVDARLLTVEDEYGDFWNIRVKVKEPLQIEDGDSAWRGEYYRFRVVLESVGSPAFKSRDEIRAPLSGSGSEGRYGGFKLGKKLGAKWNKHIASLEIDAGATDTPLKIILEVKNGKSVEAPIVIKNLSTGSTFTLNTSMSGADRVIIDGHNFKIFKNDADITILRSPWSPFPQAFGRTKFIVEDADGRFVSDDLNVYAWYYKQMI